MGFSKTRLIISIIVAAIVFFTVGHIAFENGAGDGGAFAFAIPAALLVIIIFNPKLPQTLWRFMLDRIRELSKAIQGKE